VPDLAKVIQDTTLHIFWAEQQGFKLPPERENEVRLRAVWQKLERMFELDGAELTQARPIERKLVGNCRDITTLAVSYLRHQGIPARARCGFGTYFMPDHFEDHWIVELWNATEKRWQMADFQLNGLMRSVLNITFDTLDMPPGAFINAGEAWQMCRSQKANPDAFGIFQWHGWNFIRGNVVRDLLALNRIEILPWDFWTFNEPEIEQALQETWQEVDQIADMLTHVETRFEDLTHFYSQHTLYHPPFLGDYLL
jgi:hypothetical protein